MKLLKFIGPVVIAIFCLFLYPGYCNASYLETTNIGDITGKWVGTYVASQGETALTLTVVGNNFENLTAIFNFGPIPNNPKVPTGSYQMSGKYDPYTGQLSLKGVEWINKPSGYVMLNLTGRIDNGTYMGSKWNFKLTHQKDITPPLQLSDITGKWVGTYVASQGETALTLAIVGNSFENLTAIFNFGPTPNNPKVPTGSYQMSGKYDPYTEMLSLKGVEWIDKPNGYIMINLTGCIDNESGTYSGSQWNFKLTHQKVVPVTKDDLIGRWKGTWSSYEGESNATLTIDKNNEGLFEFGPRNNDVPFGSCCMDINYGSDGTINLIGYKWLNKPSDTFIFPNFKVTVDSSHKAMNGYLDWWSDKPLNFQYQGKVTPVPVTDEAINNIYEIRSAVLVYNINSPVYSSNYKILTPDTEVNYTDAVYLSILVNYIEEKSLGWGKPKTYEEKSVLTEIESDKTDWFAYSNEYHQYLTGGIQFSKYKPNYIDKGTLSTTLSNLIPGDTVSIQGRFRYVFLRPGVYVAANSTIKVKTIPFEVSEPPEESKDLEQVLNETFDYELKKGKQALTWCSATTRQLIELMPSAYGVSTPEDIAKLFWNLIKDQNDLQQAIAVGEYDIEDNWTAVGEKTFQMIKLLESIGK